MRLLFLGMILLAGCSGLKTETQTTERGQSPGTPGVPGPGKYSHRESQFVFYSDYPLEANQPLFKELDELREQICGELKLPTSNNLIQVFLFEDQEHYEKYMRSRYAELPPRRAFFIKQPKNAGGADDLMVFTYRGQFFRQDLRHELTHGILHSVLRDVPLWLDEGLAEVYELPPENNGINSSHLEQIRRAPFQPDMARLEQLGDVKQMQRPEYREAWAWVHFMLRGKPESKAVLLSYIQQLRNPLPQGAPMPRLLPKLREVNEAPTEAILEHVKKMDAFGSIRYVGDKR
jgi:hypothetical protein